MSKTRWLILPVAAVLVTLALACGGDSKNTASGNTGGSGSGGSGSTVSNELDLTRSAQSLANVKSFRFDMTLKMDFGDPKSRSNDDLGLGAMFLALFSNIKAEGAYVGPDRYEMKIALFGEEVHVIQIGQKAWTKEGSRWIPTTPDDAMGFLGSPTGMPFDFLPQDVLKGAKTKSENANGVKTTRYSFDKAAMQKMGDELGDFDEISDANLDIWVTEDNVPVKMSMKVKGKADGENMSIELEFNVKDLNSSSIKIEPPV
jgi:hypothetical protein